MSTRYLLSGNREANLEGWSPRSNSADNEAIIPLVLYARPDSIRPLPEIVAIKYLNMSLKPAEISQLECTSICTSDIFKKCVQKFTRSLMASELIECLPVRTTKVPDVDSRIGYLYQQGVMKSPQARQWKPYIIPSVTTMATGPQAMQMETIHKFGHFGGCTIRDDAVTGHRLRSYPAAA
ncbi:hypothetical protein CBL_00646 [Carabus blaptoides fortunei]